jgi:hypothetical protein
VTTEERKQRVRNAIERGLDDFYTRLDLGVSRGDFTEKEVKEQLAFYDLEDGWDEYIEEGAK